MIEIHNLSKIYNGKIALNNISLSLERGEIVGLLGRNGAGKSTLMNVITGYESMTSGDIIIDGDHILENPIAIKAKLGYLPDTPPLYEEMTVQEYLRFVAKLKNIKKNLLQDEIDQKIEKLNLEKVRHQLIKSLSKGYKQRVGIAQAILGNPPLIILDEPTSGLDPKELIEIRKTIQGLKESSLVIVSSHILSEVNSICTKLVVIQDGEIVSEGAMDLNSFTTENKEKLLVRLKDTQDTVESLFYEIKGILQVNRLPAVESNYTDYALTYHASEDIREAVYWKLSSHGIPMVQMTKREDSLEEQFMRLTLQKKEEIQ